MVVGVSEKVQYCQVGEGEANDSLASLIRGSQLSARDPINSGLSGSAPYAPYTLLRILLKSQSRIVLLWCCLCVERTLVQSLTRNIHNHRESIDNATTTKSIRLLG
jgi:hypothetical protein